MAGGSVLTGLRLAVAMIGFQVSIGALNDLVDAPLDAGRKPGKPIPRGAASPRTARLVVVLGAVGGLALSAVSGPTCIAVALAGLACGYAYDVRLSRGPWSWLPLALALPLVPIFSWLGATGTAPPALAALLPIGALAGSGLAVSNALADLERDLSSGARSVAVRLGRARAWAVHVVLLGAAIGLAVLLVPQASIQGARAPATLPTFGLGLGTVLIGAGALLGRSGGPGRRERAWELEATGVAVLGGSWLAAVAGLG